MKKTFSQMCSELALTPQDTTILCVITKHRETTRTENILDMYTKLSFGGKMVAEQILRLKTHELPSVLDLADHFIEWDRHL